MAGLLAGPTIRLTGPDSNHTTLANYVFLRGLVLLIRCGNLPSAPEWRKKALAPTRWSHGDVMLMCLAVSQLGYSWLVTPKVDLGVWVVGNAVAWSGRVHEEARQVKAHSQSAALFWPGIPR